MGFSGFPAGGLEFLRALGEHNDREWFEAHRAVWDEEIIPAMLAWCEELAERLRDVMPRLVFVPRVGGSLYRLNRDIRFSRDKSPYKTHVAALGSTYSRRAGSIATASCSTAATRRSGSNERWPGRRRAVSSPTARSCSARPAASIPKASMPSWPSTRAWSWARP